MTQEEIREKALSLEESIQRKEMELRDLKHEFRELKTQCSHPKKIDLPDGTRQQCRDCRQININYGKLPFPPQGSGKLDLHVTLTSAEEDTPLPVDDSLEENPLLWFPEGDIKE